MARPRRGISDVIAVVLMIAIAISIGVFVTTFATKWVQDQTSSQSINCAIKTNYVIDDVKYNFSGDEFLLIRVTNRGDQGLYEFGFVLSNETSLLNIRHDSQFIKNQVTASNPLERERTEILRVNITRCFNQTLAACNESQSYPAMARTADKLTVTNEACKAVSAHATTVRSYP